MELFSGNGRVVEYTTALLTCGKSIFHNKIRPLGILSWEGEELMRLHPSLGIYKDLMVPGGGTNIFFSGVATGKMTKCS